MSSKDSSPYPGPDDVTSLSAHQPPTETRTLREDLLDAAKYIVVGDRDQQYSGPEDSFAVIARLWTPLLERKMASPEVFKLTPADVALMMTLLKAARLITGGTRQEDTWTDIAGYAACGYEVSERTEH